jgi:hypothetical protein
MTLTAKKCFNIFFLFLTLSIIYASDENSSVFQNFELSQEDISDIHLNAFSTYML